MKGYSSTHTMFTNVPITKEVLYHGQPLKLQTGLLAQQATASVTASIGETTVMANVVIGNATDRDYFPLQVMYEEKLYASGKIKGSRFIKREGRPTENAILTGRMIDRSLRSLFDGEIRNEIQVIITVLSLDEMNPPDTLGVLAASSALRIATNQFQGPISSVRIGLGKSSIKKEILETLEHHTYAAQAFSEIKMDVIEACRAYDINNPEDQEYIRAVAKALAAKDADWARFFSDLYKQSERYTPDELKTKYESAKKMLVNPTYEEQATSDIDLVVSGNGHNIVMVEAGAQIISEEIVGECLDAACAELKILTEFQEEFLADCRTAHLTKNVELISVATDDKFNKYWSQFRTDLEVASFGQENKEARAEALNLVRSNHLDVHNQVVNLLNTSELVTIDLFRDELVKAEFEEVAGFNNDQILVIAQNLIDLVQDSDLEDLRSIRGDLSKSFDYAVKKLVHEKLLQDGIRIDGRALNEVRPIMSQVDVLPRVHGSSLFQRGETQVLNILTLGTLRDAQTMDDMEDFEETTKRYLHHYNFPLYSVGETGRYGAPSRREIGHGALAEKALLPVLPDEEEFPYTMRLVSECLGSNGSTSMASTCSSCLSLMAGGVPIKDMVAGIAMGLVLNQVTGDFKVLTDILGAEDHYGDMDFKVTGTANGVTAIQLDNKVAGLTPQILKQALIEAKAGRLHILGKMQEAITEPRENISEYAPRVLRINVPVDKIGDVIGPSGKIIKGITAKYNVEIDIADDTGVTHIYGRNAELAEQARSTIAGIIKEFEVGDKVEATIYRIEQYGAFAKLLENGEETSKEGLIHISNLKKERVAKVEDVVTMGQTVIATIVEINNKGQIALSLVDDK
jgi:polyribonucleotide nucleotidyltransferase